LPIQRPHRCSSVPVCVDWRCRRRDRNGDAILYGLRTMTGTSPEHARHVCNVRVNCRACRANAIVSTDTGERFRDQAGLPDTCPEGFTADNLPDVPDYVATPEPPAWIAARRVVCEACDGYARCFPDAEQKPCRRNNRLANVVAQCHRDRWDRAACWPEKAVLDAMVKAGVLDGRKWAAEERHNELTIRGVAS